MNLNSLLGDSIFLRSIICIINKFFRTFLNLNNKPLLRYCPKGGEHVYI